MFPLPLTSRVHDLLFLELFMASGRWMCGHAKTFSLISAAQIKYKPVVLSGCSLSCSRVVVGWIWPIQAAQAGDVQNHKSRKGFINWEIKSLRSCFCLLQTQHWKSFTPITPKIQTPFLRCALLIVSALLF